MSELPRRSRLAGSFFGFWGIAVLLFSLIYSVFLEYFSDNRGIPRLSDALTGAMLFSAYGLAYWVFAFYLPLFVILAIAFSHKWMFTSLNGQPRKLAARIVIGFLFWVFFAVVPTLVVLWLFGESPIRASGDGLNNVMLGTELLAIILTVALNKAKPAN